MTIAEVDKENGVGQTEINRWGTTTVWSNNHARCGLHGGVAVQKPHLRHGNKAK